MRIFISHSTKDDEFVNKLAIGLQSLGYATWVDHLEMAPGAKWVDVIEDALENCEVLLLVLSNSALESDYVKREWHVFFDLNRPIIPIRIEDCKTPLLLRTLQHLNYSLDSDFEDLLKRLGAALPLTDAAMTGAPRTNTAFQGVTIAQIRENLRNMKKTEKFGLNHNELTLLIPGINKVLVYPLNQKLVIGRKHEQLKTYPDIDLGVYPGSEKVSRRHAAISLTDEGVQIVDLWSSNGTYVGRTRLTPNVSHRLKDGDIIRFGREFAVQVRFREPHVEDSDADDKD